MGLQRQLEAILEQHLESELSRSSAVFTSVMRPYISRNETELELLNLTNNKMQQLRQEIDRIRSMIYSNFGTYAAFSMKRLPNELIRAIDFAIF